jgi:hypothetical protein
MGEATMSNEFPVDSAGFNNADQLPDELPADFSDFDDATPDELPADFADFDEDHFSGPPPPNAAPPAMTQSFTTAAYSDSSRLLSPFSREEREQIIAFTQILGATVTHVVPRGTPDPIFPREAARNWETWCRQRDDRIFLRAREGRSPKSVYEQELEKGEEEKREKERRKEWLLHQRRIGHGWAKYVYWLERSPREARAYRNQHEDELGEWLAEIAVSPRFKVRSKASTTGKLKEYDPEDRAHHGQEPQLQVGAGRETACRPDRWPLVYSPSQAEGVGGHARQHQERRVRKT